MSWNNVDDKHKRKYDRNFVACDEQYERKFVIDTIMEEFPYFDRKNVEKAVDHCCKKVPAPRERKVFLKCVADNVGKV